MHQASRGQDGAPRFIALDATLGLRQEHWLAKARRPLGGRFTLCDRRARSVLRGLVNVLLQVQHAAVQQELTRRRDSGGRRFRSCKRNESKRPPAPRICIKRDSDLKDFTEPHKDPQEPFLGGPRRDICHEHSP